MTRIDCSRLTAKKGSYKIEVSFRSEFFWDVIQCVKFQCFGGSLVPHPNCSRVGWHVAEYRNTVKWHILITFYLHKSPFSTPKLRGQVPWFLFPYFLNFFSETEYLDRFELITVIVPYKCRVSATNPLRRNISSPFQFIFHTQSTAVFYVICVCVWRHS